MVSDLIFSMKVKTEKNHNTVTKPTQENLKELIVKFQPKLKSFIRKRVPNNEDAEDILQDVFYQLVKTVNKVMDPIDNASAWLYPGCA